MKQTEQIQEIDIDKITPNPKQPRTVFDADELAQLAASIRTRGLRQPIQVQQGADGYILVAGERRLRAHQLIGEKKIKAIIQQSGDEKSLLIDAMVENCQRHNMNPVDEADGYKSLRDEFKMSVRKISNETGVYESRVSTMLKLASLEKPIKDLIKDGRLPSSSDAVKALLSLPAGSVRIEFAKANAARMATIKMIVRGAERLNKLLGEKKTVITSEAPAIKVGRQISHQQTKKLPAWNALKQAGKVPPWELLTRNIEDTCSNCSLRDMASVSTCRDCPLADMVKRLVEVCNVPSC
jgi:ParB family chromosome partitioning protein